MRRYGSGIQITPTGWLGLAWVYSGILWLIPLWLGWTAGNLELVGLAFLRMVATLSVGVAICANERWGWATALVLAGSYTVLSIAVLGVILFALLTHPDALSWQPVLGGLTAAQSRPLLVGAAVVVGACLGAIVLLWRARSGYDVPPRRVYSTLVRFGLGPAMGILLIDGALLLSWS
jgi:hypothetical protein